LRNHGASTKPTQKRARIVNCNPDAEQKEIDGEQSQTAEIADARAAPA
jgi:hypothetical protein